MNDDNACTRTRNVYMHCLSHTDQWLDHGRQDDLIHGGGVSLYIAGHTTSSTMIALMPVSVLRQVSFESDVIRTNLSI